MKSLLRAVGFAVLLGTIISCSNDEDAVVVSPVPAFDPTLEPVEIWQKNVDTSFAESIGFGLSSLGRAIWPWSGSAGKDRPQEMSSLADLTPVVYGDSVIVGNGEGLLMSLSKDGDVQWRHWIGLNLSGGFSAGSGLVVFGTLDGEVVALNADTGEEKWRNLVSSEVISPPAIGEGKVIVRTIDSRLFALSADTGERQWQADKNMPLLTQRGTSAPMITGGIVLAGFDNGKIAAFRGDNGAPLWEKRVGQPTGRSEIERIVDIDSDPVVYGTVLYAASFNGGILAVDLRNGETVFQRDVSTYQNMAVDFEHLVVSSAKGHVSVLDRQTGYIVWTQKALENRRLSAPSLLGGYVIVGDMEGNVYWLDRKDGHFVARTKFNADTPETRERIARGATRKRNVSGSSSAAELQSQPVVFDGKVLLFDRDNQLTLMTLP